MRTTFEVFPGSAVVPSFRQVCSLASQNCRAFLRELGFDCHIPFQALVKTNSGENVPINPDSRFFWGEDQYGLFYIPGVDGCTDVTLWRTYAVWKEELEDEVAGRALGESWHQAVQTAVRTGHFWVFRRSMGQPALINLGYGMLAAAVAELTNGFITTTDAWDSRYFPARAHDFKTWYFRPPFTDEKVWFSDQTESLLHELRNARLPLFPSAHSEDPRNPM